MLIPFNEVACVTSGVEYGELLPVVVVVDVGRHCPANPLSIIGSIVSLIELLPQICNKGCCEGVVRPWLVRLGEMAQIQSTPTIGKSLLHNIGCSPVDDHLNLHGYTGYPNNSALPSYLFTIKHYRQWHTLSLCCGQPLPCSLKHP